ncbi:hypothetical protein CWB99_05085 [Pseudoalteromonas rubra]|uniref:Outer membrane protein beta-barrel domain-containing protein n=1 Tax=Pseudoalteromonas rubra TaxID=43658 RepID=A0A5S3WQ03_9GAMM|nr:hypothetical protein [Pseudoalteromonas rubra]TMP30901.1 hypothetical protein CWB99_05085 [Pseudoalteromonas rubra]TMP37113.1 hypothetical protein CWC00_00325 [Pseudoalteromonas rubra]
MKKLGLAVLAALSTSTFASEEAQSPWSLSATVGYSMGGDTIGRLTYEDNSTDSVKAGDGFILGGALNYAINQTFDIRFNATYHFDSANAENGDVTFSRFALEAVPYYKINQQFKFGLGIGLDTAVELDNDFSSNADFDSAGKFIVSGMYTFEDFNGSLEMRYSVVEYELSKIGGYSYSNTPKLDGNHLGLLFHWNF